MSLKHKTKRPQTVLLALLLLLSLAAPALAWSEDSWTGTDTCYGGGNWVTGGGFPYGGTSTFTVASQGLPKCTQVRQAYEYLAYPSGDKYWSSYTYHPSTVTAVGSYYGRIIRGSHWLQKSNGSWQHGVSGPG